MRVPLEILRLILAYFDHHKDYLASDYCHAEYIASDDRKKWLADLHAKRALLHKRWLADLCAKLALRLVSRKKALKPCCHLLKFTKRYSMLKSSQT
jgi:hypothetical protein